MPNEIDSVFTVVPDLKTGNALSSAAQVLPKSTALVGRYSKVESLEPTSYKDATSSKNRYEWQHAIGEELNSLLENQTWILRNRSEVPMAKRPLGNKWVFTEIQCRWDDLI